MNAIRTISFVLLLVNQSALASKALYSITPETSPTIYVPINSTANISYRVQNQTQQTQSLSLQNNFGVTQVVQSGFCNNPFTLHPNESCLLSLTVDGSKITASKSIIGPEVCKTNSSFFCSLPSLENRLNIEITTPTPSETHLLIANNGTANVGFISDCLVSDSGDLENCRTLSDSDIEQANGVAVTTNQHLYTANGNSNNIAICSIDTGLTNCVQDNAGNLLDFPTTVYIHNNYLYVTNDESDQVIKCDIDSITGGLSSCASTGSGFNGPTGSMTISNQYAYIANTANDTVSICSVSAVNGTLSGCSNFTPTPNVSATSGIAISESYAYIVGLGGLSIVTCEVNANDGTLSNCFETSVLSLPLNSGIAVLNNYLYVSNRQNQVEKCSLGSNGSILACDPTGSGFIAPAGNMTFITR